MANQNNHVIRYRRKPKAAAIIFAVIIVYIICFVVMYMSKSKVQTYEVETGSLNTNEAFTGIAVREEKVYNSSYSGNINYYQREGTKVKTDDTIYTVDETGRVADILSQYSVGGANSLSDQALSTIKITLNNFKTDYDGSDFSKIYDLKADLNSTVLQALNENLMENLESIVESTGSSNLFQTVKSDTGGVVVYSIDGYETVTDETVTKEMFDKTRYTKNSLKSESLVVSGNPTYKLVTSENWYLLIPLTSEDISRNNLTSKTAMTIKFKKDNITTTGAFSIVTVNGNSYGRISLDKYMIRYATDRFLDIELVTSGFSGLKIPVSAAVEQEFYTIPKEYLTTGGNDSDYGFITESYNSDGQLVPRFVKADIYKLDDTYCYVNKSTFNAGTVLVKSDSASRFVAGQTEKLKGVYCVNTGYTVFELIDIIDENKEYYIVKKGVAKGVSIYDRIVLDASKYTENEMIY
ncbi:MAG: HlyD family efflux transporter periplasmic adaptor subunit [Eubacteriales bacterium]|nr:HlyD family efflux transporter periplasmic adaptor subunit [Eubacteriales bacterium]